MKTICRYLVNSLGLDQETYDVIYYGLFVVVTNLFSILSVLLLGLLLNELNKTALFLLFFGPLRLYLGGYHASSPMKCYILFNAISVAFIMMFKFDINFLLLQFITFILLFTVLVQLISAKQNKNIVVVVLIHMVLIIVLKSYNNLDVFLLSVLMNVLLYEMKYIIEKCK